MSLQYVACYRYMMFSVHGPSACCKMYAHGSWAVSLTTMYNPAACNGREGQKEKEYIGDGTEARSGGNTNIV